ncbi:MAG TPA: chitobiase/beta-hexosaminidase C-terminal domain-containing protein [Spirochaetia bacterium]|nr:chitobiase/beta-hexosaminidase C-terminal domain-containing protein [Spirochaetia bacterium]
MARFTRLASIFAVCIVLVNCPSTPKPPENTVAGPAFTPAEGVYTTPQSVAMATSTDGAEIRYTTDGTAPTATTGTVYSSPVTVSATTTLKAIATKKGWADSPVVSATFTIQAAAQKAADVQFDPPAGSFPASATVTLSSATDGAEIYYTTDGSTPSASNGTLYAGPVSVTSTETITAIAIKPSFTDSGVTSALYTIAPQTAAVQPITDQEVADARNALARAREVDADYFDPDNYGAARQALDDGIAARTSDPAAARQKLAEARDKADLAFSNSVQKAEQVMAANLDAARKRLLDLEADKWVPDDFQKATGGIDEAASLFASKDYAGSRARAYQALKDMTDLANRLETHLAAVKSVRYETEQLMKQAESEELYQYAPDQRDKVLSLYTKGVDSWQAYKLDDAEENFGAAREAARDTIRIAREARDSSQAAQKQKAEAMQQQVMKALVDASTLTVVTEDGTVVRPQNWKDEDFLKQIDQMMQQEQQNAAPSTNGSMAIPSDGSTAVMADDTTVSLLQQARDLWTQGLKEKAAGNYGKALDYFAEAQRYVDIYKSFAVKGVYTVRLIPDRRDCLWRIAEYKDIYGDPYLWPNLWRRNRKLIQNPDLIYPGWQLVVPPQ